jgi:membrane-associated protease RseP (regulator of RpoE activity)
METMPPIPGPAPGDDAPEEPGTVPEVPRWPAPAPGFPARPYWLEVSPRVHVHSRRHILLAASLFLLTVASTSLTWGLAYSAAIMTILLCHEMGHYIMCRRYRVSSTLPLFVPLPYISPFGTMGAVIFMRQLGENRRVLFDIGIAGPLAGLVPSLVATVWGLAHSQVIPLPPAGFAGIRLGNSLLFSGLQSWLHPGMGPGQDLMLHPVAYAGWAGLFVTALNLLPIGQLDGGHVIYGLFGRRSVYVAWTFLAALAVLAVFNPEWWVLVAILLGIFAMAVFVLSFTPRPFLLH